jgi:hypothetical protein
MARTVGVEDGLERDGESVLGHMAVERVEPTRMEDRVIRVGAQEV